MKTEDLGARYKTKKSYRVAASASIFTVDLEAAGNLGAADAVVVSISGADRTVHIHTAGDSSPQDWTVEDGRDPVFEIRTTKVVVEAGTSATIEILALYIDRWES